ncbi:MAG TPA: UDP-N-acetylmuramate dehydrogenase [Candidatus Magasanikbacteria bacterium]|nr:UDP-N-acetylmuramate dehydrogenase [Candidatus Magasanikbacteria bacterium]
MNELYKELKKYGEVKTKIPLSKHTTFQIGGWAEFFIEVKETELLIQLLDFLNSEGVEFFILGGGSNLLWIDQNFSGVVIKIATSGLKLKEEFVEVEAGVPLSLVVNLAVKNELSGLEWAVGIPGTLGGAVRGNAGSMGKSMADCIQKVFVWVDGEVKEYSKAECGFGYRESIFKSHKNMVVLKTTLKLEKSSRQEVSSVVAKNLGNRKNFPKWPSAGSFFKNIRLENWPQEKEKLPDLFISRGTVPAGWLIENCGLKGFRIGDAGVSQEHGNFLVNFGSATQEQVLQVVEEVQKKVYDKYGVSLEPEVQIVSSR